MLSEALVHHGEAVLLPLIGVGQREGYEDDHPLHS